MKEFQSVKMKETILIAHNYYQLPGGEDSVFNNEKYLLLRNGHKVITYNRHNSEIKNMSIFRLLLIPLEAVFSVKTFREINKLIKVNDVDIIHVHNTLSLISPSIYYAALWNKTPVVQTVHNFRLMCPAGTYYRNGKICEECSTKSLFTSISNGCYRNSKIQTGILVMNLYFHRFTKVYKKINFICLTSFNKSKLCDIGIANESSVFIKPNFSKKILKITPYNLRKNQFVYVGRIDRIKGIDLLLTAWKKMGENAPKLIICGTGPLENWCREYISDNMLKDKIILKGFVENDEAIKIISESKALILPTQWYEGFPMTIVESFSVGTPVIGSNIGNVGSIIESEKNGWIFKHDSIESLISVIEKNEDIVDETYNSYCRVYSENVNYDALISIYKSIRNTEQ